MGKTLTFIFIVVCTAALTGCNDGSDPEGVDALPIIVADDSTFLAYINIWRDSLHVIEKIDGEVKGDILHLNITYLAGCEEYSFEMVAARGIDKSLPPGGHTLLINSGPADTCQVETRIALDFDLTPYREHLQTSGLHESGKIIIEINSGLFAFDYVY